MTTILLTGATGYLGTKIGNMLLQNGYNLLTLHLNHNEVFICENEYENNITKIYLSDNTIEEIFDKYNFDGIIHTATLYGRNGESISDIIKTNVLFPTELISNSVKHNLSFFINTDTILNKYVSPYALTKSHLTEWMKLYEDDIKMIDIKLDHFYGPKDKNTKFVAAMLEKLLKNEPEIKLTEGNQTRDFIYVDDVVEVYKTILQNIDNMGKGQIHTFEVGAGQKVSIKYIVQKLKALTGSKSELIFGAIPYRKNEILDYEVNTTALKLLGWMPKINIDEGLEHIVKAETEKL